MIMTGFAEMTTTDRWKSGIYCDGLRDATYGTSAGCVTMVHMEDLAQHYLLNGRLEMTDRVP
jgi:hypothetical protein